MMPTFPQHSLKFRTAGFPQYGFKAGYQTAPSRRQRVLRVVRFASVLRAPRLPAPYPRSKSRNAGHLYTSVQAAIAALPQGPSLRSGLCCPGPSSLNWPHQPHQGQLVELRLASVRIGHFNNTLGSGGDGPNLHVASSGLAPPGASWTVLRCAGCSNERSAGTVSQRTSAPIMIRCIDLGRSAALRTHPIPLLGEGMQVLTDLQNRGVKDIFIACVD